MSVTTGFVSWPWPVAIIGTTSLRPLTTRARQLVPFCFTIAAISKWLFSYARKVSSFSKSSPKFFASFPQKLEI